ncbi:MAG: helix-turn-helix domain-containing protein [Anaerolineaceae bacterium]
MSKTVGQILHDARTLKEISLQDAARVTHIRLQYLQELENDRPELLPSRAQARGFLRLYAAFLEIDPAELLTLLEKPDDTSNQNNQPEEQKSVEDSIPENIEKESAPQTKKRIDISAKLTSLLKKLPKIFKKKIVAPPENSPKKIQKQKKAEEPVKEKTQKEPNATRSSLDVFKEVGEQMRMRREKLGLSLSDVEQFTRLRRMYIQAIEEGRIEDLPSSVQGRGMVANYAHFLEMDQDAVMNLYAEGLEEQRREKRQEKWTPREPAIRVSVHIPEKLRRLLSPDLLFGSLVVIGLFVLIFWGASQIFGNKNDATPTAALSISEMLQSTVTPTLMQEMTASIQTTENGQEAATPAVTQATVQPATPIATANAAPLQLYIVAQQRAWMRVTVDGEVEFEGRILPGNAYTFSGQGSILLLTGNGAALEVYFNQEYLGNLGKLGEVVNLNFSAAGLSIPTPTITPTILPSLTPTPSLTTTPTANPQNTPTPGE